MMRSSTPQKLATMFFMFAMLLIVQTVWGSEKSNAQVTAPGETPIIVALDGIDSVRSECICRAGLQLGVFLRPLLCGGWDVVVNPAIRTANYLAPELRTRWGVDAHTVFWPGSPRDATSYQSFLLQTKEVLLDLLDNNPDRRIVIVAHSWGSVVAFKVLTDLQSELAPSGDRRVPPDSIAQLITIGSPLQARWLTRVVTEACWGGQIPGQELITSAELQKPDTVQYWTNFWISEDPVSGPKDAADQNIRFAYPGVISQDAHSAYFMEQRLARQMFLNMLDTCADLFTFEESVESGYGAAYDTISSFKELLVQAACDGRTVRVSVGSGLPTQYVYRFGYEWTGSEWRPFELSGPPVRESVDWLVGQAFVEFSRTPIRLAQDNLIVAYVCTWEPSVTGSTGRWKCGCRNSACTQSFWQLQNFRRQ